MVRALLAQGARVTILDNFCTGHAWATQEQEVIEVDLRNLPALRKALAPHDFDGVFHFAARSLVGESNQDPMLYWQNNVGGTANLIEVALEKGWTRCVFSSTAAVYGNPQAQQIDEEHPKEPINVYGRTKLVMETLLRDVCTLGGMSALCLRYFNAAGAAGDASIGELHEPETHLIPNALRAASGAGPALTIFGDDYPTPDGTCVRDYIHVEDLAEAHLRAMTFLASNPGFHAMNLGNGSGFSVREVFNVCEEVVGRAIPHTMGNRRPGDPAMLVANADQARTRLGWTPQHSQLESIVGSAWAWEQTPRSRT